MVATHEIRNEIEEARRLLISGVHGKGPYTFRTLRWTSAHEEKAPEKAFIFQTPFGTRFIVFLESGDVKLLPETG